MNTIGDLDDSHGDAEDSVNNKSITSMDINQLYQDVAPKIDFDALLKNYHGFIINSFHENNRITKRTAERDCWLSDKCAI